MRFVVLTESTGQMCASIWQKLSGKRLLRKFLLLFRCYSAPLTKTDSIFGLRTDKIRFWSIGSSVRYRAAWQDRIDTPCFIATAGNFECMVLFFCVKSTWKTIYHPVDNNLLLLIVCYSIWLSSVAPNCWTTHSAHITWTLNGNLFSLVLHFLLAGGKLFGTMTEMSCSEFFQAILRNIFSYHFPFAVRNFRGTPDVPRFGWNRKRSATSHKTGQPSDNNQTQTRIFTQCHKFWTGVSGFTWSWQYGRGQHVTGSGHYFCAVEFGKKDVPVIQTGTVSNQRLVLIGGLAQ